MNKNKVEEYIREAMTLKLDVIRNNSIAHWPSDYRTHFDAFPKKLYKYVPIKNYYIDSIRNNYIYLCPAKELDDQFECRVDFPVSKYLSNRSVIDDVFIEALINKVTDYPCSFDKMQMKITIRNCLDKQNNLDLGKVHLQMTVRNADLTEEQKSDYLKAFAALMSGAWISKSNEDLLLWLINKAQRAQDETGIGSLSETNKSQVMWDIYADHYAGVCIEYNLHKDIDAIINTFPVLYENKRRINLLQILVGICLDEMILCFSKGKIGDYYSVKDYIKLFLTKNNEWAFQKEWRIIGEAGAKFYAPRISRIYLGKRISKESKDLMKAIANEKNIMLFQQLDNFDSLELKFERIELE